MTSLIVSEEQISTGSQAHVSFAWLELTPNCQLTCEHCYVASRPGLGHGKLSVMDWKRTMDELRSMGVQDVQFIGGEPTTHPHFCELVEYAAGQGFSVEVYSNLVGITQRMWDVFIQHHVSVATSFYSAEAGIHDTITNLHGSHQKTIRNIKKALTLGLSLRVGIIHLHDDQDIPAAEAFLQEIGVDPTHIGVDRVRGVGRGFNLSQEDAISALCGKCTRGQCVITAEGTVYPCIMARSFPLGNVLFQTIDDILTGETFKSTSDVLNAAFVARVSSSRDQVRSDCDPCRPNHCNPFCQPDCQPNCWPNAVCGPTKGPPSLVPPAR